MRIDLMVPLKFGGQWRERIKAGWRHKSFKPWSRNYIERGQRFVESEYVTTTEIVVAPLRPAVPPCSEAFSTSAFLPLPIAREESGEVGAAEVVRR
jgi:hypothetical protein